MTRTVCLANSRKEQGRCLAGIDLDTKKWVRPVSKRYGGTLTVNEVTGIQILDIIEIPLSDGGPDEGCQPENRIITGRWKKIDQMKPQELLDFCEDSQVILHDNEKSISIEYFTDLPREKWKSLQLVHQRNARFIYTDWPERRKYEAILRTSDNTSIYLSLTDLSICQKLDDGEPVSKNCIITVSLATPWAKDNKCYKVVAGVIEL
jgi:hypothetical protein